MLTVADCIENGKEIPQVEAGAAITEAQTGTIGRPATERKEEGPVEVGSVSLSLALFHIATEEAAGHVQALYAQLAVLHETATHIVTHEFMRAAHTLAGVNRTMGFVQIAELAYALEQWLEVRVDKPNVVSEQQMLLIDQVVLQLDEMCAMVRENRQEPVPHPELIAQLQAIKEIAETEEVATREPEMVPPLDFEPAIASAESVAEPQSPSEITLDFALPAQDQSKSPEELQVAATPDTEPEADMVAQESATLDFVPPEKNIPAVQETAAVAETVTEKARP